MNLEAGDRACCQTHPSQGDVTELAWAAGLFEGEGCATACNGKPRLQLKMVSERHVRRFHAAIGAGSVYGPYGPYASQLGDKPTWVWVARGDDHHAAHARLAPFLTSPLDTPHA